MVYSQICNKYGIKLLLTIFPQAFFHILGHCQIYELENKGMVFKARWFVWLDITRARPLFKWNNEGIARVISRKIMVIPIFYQAVQTRHTLKTIPLFSFLNIFDLNMQNVTKNDV